MCVCIKVTSIYCSWWINGEKKWLIDIITLKSWDVLSLCQAPRGPRPHPWRRRERTTKAPICQTSPGGTSWRSDQDLTQQKLGFSSSKSVSGLPVIKKNMRFRKSGVKTPGKSVSGVWLKKCKASWDSGSGVKNTNSWVGITPMNSVYVTIRKLNHNASFPRFSTWDRLRFPRLNLPSLLLVI